jgi:hypothetical protein
VARPEAPVRPWRTSSAEPRRHRIPRRRRPVLRVVLALVATVVFVTGWSVGHALTVPGGGTFAERIAEWARSHQLGFMVTFGEWLTYTPPKVGGTPNVSFDRLGGKALQSCDSRKLPATTKASACLPHPHGIAAIVPAKLTSPAGRALPGEGVWRVAVSVHGVPAMLKTYVRESKIYSSYYAGIVSMDPRLLKFSLRPGTEDPGPGNWGAPMYIPPGHRRGLAATFNSGFRIYAAQGGFYLHGHYDGALVKGAASEVYFKDGQLAIGAWGYGNLHMGPDIAAVRQNLRLLIDNGTIASNINLATNSSWGATLGGGYYVWRSGVGITSDGRIIFVYGPALDARELAVLLKLAGCVRAMELDINPDWMSFMYYLPNGHPGNPTPVNLLKGQVQPPYRYYSLSNRDFTAVYAR